MDFPPLTEIACAVCGRIAEARPYNTNKGPWVARLEQCPEGWTVVFNGEEFLCSEVCSRMLGNMLGIEEDPT